MVIKSSLPTGGIEAPAITIVARNPDTKMGWRYKENQPASYSDILRHQCKDYLETNIEHCINQKTYDRSEVIADSFSGSLTTTPTNNFTSDLTYVRVGRSYTLNIDRRIGFDDGIDQIFILFNYNLIYDIFIHDQNYFLNNINPFGLPSLYQKLNPNTSFNQYNKLTLTKYEELNVPSDPCVDDTSYKYETCIKEMISGRAGCK